MSPAKELYDSICKSLPQHVGETLRAELDALSALRDITKDQAATIADQMEYFSNLKAELSKVTNELSQHKLLDHRAMEIEGRERDLAVKELQLQLACEKEKTDLATKRALSLTRNTEYRQAIFGTTTVAATRPGAYAGQTVSTPYNHDKREVAE